MNLYINEYYHLYNRSNNNELIFLSEDNYIFFLKKYRTYVTPHCTTVAYCLMPTHFHFLILVQSEDMHQIRRDIADWLSSYSKAFNKRFHRHGSLFQQHTKAKHIDKQGYLVSVISYIHQNPLRNNLSQSLEGWPYSSYIDLIGERQGTLPSRALMTELFGSQAEFKKFSQERIIDLPPEYI